MPLTLPTQLKVANQNISDYPFIFTGGKTTGKTSLAAQYPNHFIAEFEVGNARHITGNWEDIHNWEEFISIVNLLESNPTYCKTFILDGINTLDYYALLASRKYFKMDEVEEISEKDRYAFWGYKKLLIKKTLQRIRALPITLGFTAHTEVTTVVDLKGRNISKLQTNITGQMKEIFDEMNIAVWGVLHRGTDNQVLMQIVEDSFVMANHKLSSHFRWNGYQIKIIPLGFTPEEGFRNFNLAFNNQLQVPDQYLIKINQQAVQPISQPISNGSPKLTLSIKKG